MVVFRPLPTTKQEQLLRTVAALDPSRYHSATEIANRAQLPLSTTRAWLTVLRMRDKIDAIVGTDGRYWYAPLEIKP